MKKTLLIFLFIPIIATAQQPFSLVIHLPQHIQKEKLQITFDNGKERKDYRARNGSDTILIRDTCYASQGVVFAYCEPDYAVYYVRSPAEIRLFSNTNTKNAVDAGPLGVDQMRFDLEKEHAAVIEAYNNVMASPAIDSLKFIVEAKVKTELAKKMQFIKKHADRYWSFFCFKDYVNDKNFPVDSLITTFNRVFPPGFKQSWEGKQTMRFLKIRKLREQKREAPDFTAKDINNNTISLQQYRNKYVLINFWATWCVPCVKEFPALNTITANIPDDKLVRIFVTQDTEMAVLQNSIKKYDLKGIHLLANSDLITLYKASAIPQVYLIDKEGKIVYDRDELKDYELEALDAIIKACQPIF